MKLIYTGDFERLKDFDFKKEAEKCYYYLKRKDFEIFIWVVKGYDYKPRHIYIEVEDYSMILSDFGILYDLIQAGLVKKEEKNENNK